MSKLMAMATGTADMCTVVPHEQWATTDSARFWLAGESPVIVLKSAEGEYSFTGPCAAASEIVRPP